LLITNGATKAQKPDNSSRSLVPKNYLWKFKSNSSLF